MSDGWSDEDDDKPAKGEGKKLKDWDCPDCNANNPSDEVVGPKGIEIRCHYCGTEFKVTQDDAKFRFRAI